MDNASLWARCDALWIGCRVVRMPYIDLAGHQAEELSPGADWQWQRLVGRSVGEPAELPSLEIRPWPHELPEVLTITQMSNHLRIFDDCVEDLARVVHIRSHVNA